MRKRKILYWLCVLLCAGGSLVFGWLFFQQWREYRVGELAYDKLQKSVISSPQRTPVQQSSITPQEELEHQPELPQIDFEALADINPDVVGWLYCPDTVISYPVPQGENNSYYLKHLFDGTSNSAGSLFLDSRCQGLEGQNSVIYGHYMKNGTLFASLSEYQEQAYYEAHPELFLITPENTLTIQLFSAYIAGKDDDAWQLTFSSEEEYDAWLERLLERSCFTSKVIPQSTDQVITFSTCNYRFPGARFVCHGVVSTLG